MNKKQDHIMVEKTVKDYKKDYTTPALRAELKEEIKEDSKGGKAGQWSARKSQILSKEYEAQGGGYKHPGKLTDSQKDLKKWTQQDWQTEDGEKAQRGNKTVRYLPKKVWDNLSNTEKNETNSLKEKGSLEHKQYVQNPTSVTKKVRKS